MAITRRRFLSGTATLAALAGVKANLFDRVAVALDADPTKTGRVLVAVQLAGGNDGLNTVVPYADPLYRKLRPNIGLAENDLLKLDERLAFNAGLASLRERFRQGAVAVVEGVGYPKADRSHFVSTAIWQTARLEPYRDPTGWLGRTIDSDDPKRGKESHPLEGLGIGGGGLTPALNAPRSAVPSLLSLDAFSVQPDRRYPADGPALRTALGAIYTSAAMGSPTNGFIHHVGNTALASSDALRTAVARYSSMVEYPRSGLSDQLKLIAQLLTANVGARIFHVTLGGFDTHANQKGQQRNLLAQLSDGVTAFLDDLKAHGIEDRVSVMTYSEFGRRAGENGSAGTDHGAASTVFVVGPKVKGGIYGPVPDLSKLEGGDVPFGVDFRSVYGSVLRDFLSINPDRILGSGFSGVHLFRA